MSAPCFMFVVRPVRVLYPLCACFAPRRRTGSPHARRMVEVIIAGGLFVGLPLFGMGARLGYRCAYNPSAKQAAALLLGSGTLTAAYSYPGISRPPLDSAGDGGLIAGVIAGVGGAGAALGCCLGTPTGYLDHGHTRLRADLGAAPPPPKATRLGVLTAWVGVCAAAYVTYLEPPGASARRSQRP